MIALSQIEQVFAMAELSQKELDEYDGISDAWDGRPALEDRGQHYLNGYAVAYETQQRLDAGFYECLRQGRK